MNFMLFKLKIMNPDPDVISRRKSPSEHIYIDTLGFNYSSLNEYYIRWEKNGIENYKKYKSCLLFFFLVKFSFPTL